tara:strand:- start:10903 stop:11124 length:222 start_codon:yes stop_codon:yes gene_type:complete
MSLLLIKKHTPFGVENPRKRRERSEREIACFDAIQTGGTAPSAQTQSGRLGDVLMETSYVIFLGLPKRGINNR